MSESHPVNAINTSEVISTEFNEFNVDRERVIQLLVKSQNGSLSIALIELISNSQDAGATRIDISLSNRTFRITDNGKGFKDKEDITKKFQTLGAGVDVHEESNIGRFHIGRSQVFSHAKCVWRSKSYQMHVDYHKKMGFDLSVVNENIKGCIVEGEFYSEIQPYSLQQTIRDIEKNVRLMRADVFINGIQANKTDHNWDFEDDILKMSIKNNGSGVEVFSNGVYIKTIPHHQYGISGEILTKKRLVLNLARNETDDFDPIWSHIQNVLRKESKKRSSENKMTATENRLFSISSFKSSDFELEEMMKAKLFKTAINKYIALGDFIEGIISGSILLAGDSSTERNMPNLCETATRTGSYLFLAESSYHEWRVATPQELIRLIINCLNIYVAYDELQCWEKSRIQRQVESLRKVEYHSIEAVRESVDVSSTTYDNKDLTKPERARRSTIEKISESIAHTMRVPVRKVFLGKKDGAEAFTDGNTMIVIDIDIARSCLKSETEYYKTILLVAHEYGHDQNNITSNKHDLEFYEDFHDLILDSNLLSLAYSEGRHYVRRNFGKLGIKKPIWMNIKEESFKFLLHNTYPLTKVQKELLNACNIEVISGGAVAEIMIPVKSLKVPQKTILNRIVDEDIITSEKQKDDLLTGKGIFMGTDVYNQSFYDLNTKECESWLDKAGLEKPFDGFTFSSMSWNPTDKSYNEDKAISLIRNLVAMFPNTHYFSTRIDVTMHVHGDSCKVNNNASFSKARLDELGKSPIMKYEIEESKNIPKSFESSLKDLFGDFGEENRETLIGLLKNPDFVDSL